MTDLNQNTSVNVDNVEPMKAEFTPDDLRVELDKLQHKLRMSDLEAERERERANGYLEKNQRYWRRLLQWLRKRWAMY